MLEELKDLEDILPTGRRRPLLKAEKTMLDTPIGLCARSGRLGNGRSINYSVTVQPRAQKQIARFLQTLGTA